MSLLIDTNKVEQVLLADGWHLVQWFDDQSTFDLDSYEYTEGDLPIFGGGSGVPSTGFTFLEASEIGLTISGPVTAILAVRYNTIQTFERENKPVLSLSR